MCVTHMQVMFRGKCNTWRRQLHKCVTHMEDMFRGKGRRVDARVN
jgi:hypothetical protein